MFKSFKIGTSRSATIVLGTWQDSKRVPPSLEKWKSKVAEILSRRTFSGKQGQTAISGDVLLVGLGKKGELDTTSLRNIGMSIVKMLDQLELHNITLGLHLSVPGGVASPGEIGRAVIEGATIANWRVDMFDGSATTTKDVLDTLVVSSQSKECVAGMKRGLILGCAINNARRVAATPPNICNPPWMAKEAKKLQGVVG